MRTYSIIGTTNQWIANRDSRFNGKTRIILATGLSLKRANDIILALYNSYANRTAANIGLACIFSNYVENGCKLIRINGLYRLEYDSRYYTIIDNEEEEYYV